MAFGYAPVATSSAASSPNLSEHDYEELTRSHRPKRRRLNVVTVSATLLLLFFLGASSSKHAVVVKEKALDVYTHWTASEPIDELTEEPSMNSDTDVAFDVAESTPSDVLPEISIDCKWSAVNHTMVDDVASWVLVDDGLTLYGARLFNVQPTALLHEHVPKGCLSWAVFSARCTLQSLSYISANDE